ncbi:mechanosensitive ion channel family protein [Nocardioides marmoribigeumensis]|uniref:Small conductance mechanosensitive channel n=1 Tax=Nocardioides marmoribigeumensis TaxID=433649 RepID=A0ABU2BSI1_9ACTN|nr:mechanosensitive ion channel family protein [Nocardioides marmoribigeumensis]MDR7361587.1 small conductance mechanosensitive channel [Nocardioides marmoribigeumensis]
MSFTSAVPLSSAAAADPTCGEGILNPCRSVMSWTGNADAAQASEWFVEHALVPVVTIVLLVVAGAVLRWVAHRSIDRVVVRAQEGVLPSRLGSFGRSSADADLHLRSRRAQRAKSLGSLLKSISSGIIFGVVLIMCLAEVKVNVAPILASAGVVGLALGFGAQALVKDFLSGIFMLVEDQYGVGDVVDLGEASGTVEAVGLRITRLRDVNGTVWYVRNGEILRVGNSSQNWARSVIDVAVGYDADIARVKRVLEEVADDMWRDEDFHRVIIEEPEVWGVEALDPDRVLVRLALKTAPLEQWRVSREMRERIKARFDHEGIRIPVAPVVVAPTK